MLQGPGMNMYSPLSVTGLVSQLPGKALPALIQLLKHPVAGLRGREMVGADSWNTQRGG